MGALTTCPALTPLHPLSTHTHTPSHTPITFNVLIPKLFASILPPCVSHSGNLLLRISCRGCGLLLLLGTVPRTAIDCFLRRQSIECVRCVGHSLLYIGNIVLSIDLYKSVAVQYHE